MLTSEDNTSVVKPKIALIGFGLLFVAGLVLWAGFGSLIFVDLASFVRSCF
jgi:hypothetical protein